MIDPIPNPNRHAPDEEPALDSLNALVQARIDGRLGRRELLRRAATLGLAAPVVAIMLHATSDLAYGKPAAGRVRAAAVRQSGATVPADAPTKPAGTPREGGTITIGTNEEPDTLNPYLTQLVTGSDLTNGVMEALLRYDSTQQLQPALAEGYEISDDGLTYTFTLRQGVTFHNGDAFGPQDVIDTWKMIMNPDFSAYQQTGWNKIEEITAPDDRTVVMKTTEVFAPFLSYVGGDFGSVISPRSELAKGPEEFKQQFGRERLVGTGPVRFVKWTAKQQVELERFADYWRGAPKLERVIVRFLPDDNTQLVQLRTGEIQMVAGAGALGAIRVDEALQFPGIVVFEHPTPGWSHLDLKHVFFLRHPLIRQALDFATPSQDIVDKLLKGYSVRSVADQAPGTWAFNPKIEGRPFDIEQAKALLAEAGLTEANGGWEGKVPTEDPLVLDGEVRPLEVELWGIAGDTSQQQIIQVVAQAWQQAGIKTTTNFQDVSTLWAPEGYQWNPDTMTACLYSWFNSNDPDDMFYWHSSQIPASPTGTGGNAVAYFNKFNFQEEIDRLTAAGAAETDQEKRKEIYWQIQELLHDQVPVIFISWGKAFPAIADNIGGFWPSAFNRMLWNVGDWYVTE